MDTVELLASGAPLAWAKTWHFDCSNSSHPHKPQDGHTSLLKPLKFLLLAHHFDQGRKVLVEVPSLGKVAH